MDPRAKKSLASCARRCPGPAPARGGQRGGPGGAGPEPVANLTSVPLQNTTQFNFGALDSVAGQLKQLE